MSLPAILLYVVQISFAWGVLALLYRFLFARETFFQLNRAYLLFSLFAGAMLPFWPALAPATGTPVLAGLALPEITVGEAAVPGTGASFTIIQVLGWLYGAGVALAFSRMLLGLGRLYWLGQTACRETLPGFGVLIRSEAVSMPFSFFHWVFVPLDFHDNEPDQQAILAHELAHARDGHSVDVIFTEIFCIIFWFHPLAHWYRKSLREVHEYLADAHAAGQSGRRQYGLLLLQQAQIVRTVSFVHHFYQSPLKQRLIMLTKKSSAPVRGLQYGLMLPVFLLLAFLFQQAPVMAQTTGTPPAKDNTVLTTCEKMPEFPGGRDALVKFLVGNLRYPPQARLDKAEAMVVMEFVVNEDGSIGKVGPKAELRDQYRPDFIEESVRVIRAMPKWIPGENEGKKVKCMVTLPIKYKLD